jgi:hypothetical protein
MITVSITTNGDTSEPMFVPRERVLGISISGTFTGTVELQRLAQEESTPYPASTGSFQTYLAKTGIFEEALQFLSPGWYRFKATAAMTGTAVCKMW